MEEFRQQETDDRFVAQLTACQIPLMAFVRSLMPGDLAAGDVVQAANAKIWEKRADFQMGTNFKAWAFSIARFEVLNYRKQQARDARLVFSDELESIFTSKLANDQDDLRRRHVPLRHCLQKLRHRDRELLLRRYAGTGTIAQLAESVGRSAGGLKVTLHRLRSALLECIRRRLQTEEAFE